jgi:CRP/FNR family transcriptional regulator, cyclic AMP receptor protein
MYSIKAPANAQAPSLRDVFDRHTLAATRVRFETHRSIYATGDADDSLYLIDAGQVKLVMSSEEGKDCLLSLHGLGDIFGESCLAGTGRRLESAVAMQFTLVRRASRREFVAEAERAGAIEALLRHLAVRLDDRQNAVFDLITRDSQQRLARVLLMVAEKLGTVDGVFLRLDQKISHEELSQIVGTTRPRITAFMQRFRTLGLIETAGRSISVHRQRTRAFLSRD